MARFAKTAKDFRWYHWAGGIATAGTFNCGILLGMAKGYRWYFDDEYQRAQQFRDQYGLPTEAQRLAVFAWLAKDWDKTIGMLEDSGPNGYRQELLSGAVGTARGDVLEVGVGTGRAFEALTAAGEVRSFVGVDCLEEMLEVARPKLADLAFPARVEAGDAHKLSFPAKSFDTVVSSLCLCSMEHPEKALEEMARVCRPDGQILILEPGVADFWPVRFFQGYLGLVPQPKHAWEYGWRDDLDPPALVHASPQLELSTVRTRAMGNWYLLVAKPRVA
mmetsp:Transcript_174344/g.558897  ORF Transcript_174344/g.558897 Transcript_174344/m.558897 type:complete len:276 (-) Transcript_174344:64-891(-)